MGELGDMRAGELLLGGAALLTAAVFGLAAGAASAGLVASGSEHSGLLWSTAGEGRIRAGQNRRFRPTWLREFTCS